MKLEAILRDPSAVYDKPADVLKDQSLNHEEKARVLDQWEYDARELQVAADENMPGRNNDFFDEVLNAQKELHGDDYENHNESDHKQGT